MAERLAMVPDLDRSACRASAETRFSRRRMVADYLALYRRVLSGSVEAPVWLPTGVGWTPPRSELGAA
jgi:hypothetical protein